MTPSWTEVNAALMAVLGEFGRSSRPAPATSRTSSPVFVDRLFSVRHAESLADQVDEVRLSSGTVVTPLARDLLKRRGVAIRLVSGRESATDTARRKGEWGFAIESRSGQVEAIRRNLLVDWWEVGPDPVDAAHWVSDAEGRGAFVLTDEASVAAWRIGRVEGVRSATVGEPEAVSRAIRGIGANVIVVEPLGKSIYLVKQLADRFRMGGAPLVPDWIEHDERPANRAGWSR